MFLATLGMERIGLTLASFMNSIWSYGIIMTFENQFTGTFRHAVTHLANWIFEEIQV
jgi:hypothetical protein